MTVSKKSALQDELIEKILTLQLAPGMALDEAAISEQYNISRTPLREVFQRLAGLGYLTLEENRGAKVSSMDLARMRNFFQTAPMVYSAIAQLAVENATSLQIKKLKAVQALFRECGEAGDAPTMVMHNHRFHQVIGEMAGDTYLEPSLNRLLIDHTRMSQKFYRPINSDERLRVWEACNQHDAMILAIENRDAKKIVELTREHWALSRDQIEKFVRPDPLEMELGLKQAIG